MADDLRFLKRSHPGILADGLEISEVVANLKAPCGAAMIQELEATDDADGHGHTVPSARRPGSLFSRRCLFLHVYRN